MTGRDLPIAVLGMVAVCIVVCFVCAMVSISASAHSSQTAPTAADQANAEIVRSVTYVMDHRANTCYARYSAITGEYGHVRMVSYTKVDCTDVRPLLVNP